VHAAPVFAGSGDVGGADADLLIDGLLIDVKTTVDANKVPTQANIWQLAGYVLPSKLVRHRPRRISDGGPYGPRSSAVSRARLVIIAVVRWYGRRR
jgi:hypothetical protein